jgi:hypothetical protein
VSALLRGEPSPISLARLIRFSTHQGSVHSSTSPL